MAGEEPGTLQEVPQGVAKEEARRGQGKQKPYLEVIEGVGMSEEMKHELKPCPFCGGKGKVSYKDYRFGGWNGKSDSRRKYRVQVICNRCRARGKPIITDWIVNHSPYQTTYWNKDSRNEEATKAFMPYIVQAIEAWNMRVKENEIN